MNIYWIIVILILGLGIPMCRGEKSEKLYIAMMTILHVGVSGLRYVFLTGDLRTYAVMYYLAPKQDWMSRELYNKGRNFGFGWLMKIFSQLTDKNFQIFLFFISAVVGIILAVIIYRYSSKPWLSYLVWNCMGFYIFGFSAIKQVLAMSLIMLSLTCIFEKKAIKFILLVLLAGTIHIPALVFLPAYWVCKLKMNMKSMALYVAAIGFVFVFKDRIVDIMSSTYYEETDFNGDGQLIGGRFIMIVLLLVGGYILNGFNEERFQYVFNIIAVAAILQLFSGYDNVFTRLADYYFQFSILFIPLIFYNKNYLNVPNGEQVAVVKANSNSKIIMLVIFLMVAALIWWYYKTNLGASISVAADDYLNYRSMFDVDPEIIRKAIFNVTHEY